MQVVEVTDLKSEVRSDLWGILDAVVVSEAKKSSPDISLNICRRFIRSRPYISVKKLSICTSSAVSL